MPIRDAYSLKNFLNTLPGSIVGVGMTAFSRVLPAYLLSRYAILSLHETGDLSVLRKKVSVFCLEEKTGKPTPASDRNAAGLLAHALSQAYLRRLPNPIYLFPYQDYSTLSALAQKNDWRILANSHPLRLRVQTRAFFEEMAAKLNLKRPSGDIVPLEVFLKTGYGQWQRLMGSNLVFQLPDICRGGGRGTFFVRCERDYQKLRDMLKGRYHHGVFLNTVSVHRLVEGPSASVAACATRNGTLVSALQRQLIDLPYCGDFVEDGVFCGHAWGGRVWNDAVCASAYDQASRIGDFLFKMGYKGIFGVDFVVQEEKSHVYPIEINPRLTGAFPMLSLLHLNAGIIPLEAFHILEFLDVSHEMALDVLNRAYKQSVEGSHLLLFFPRGRCSPDRSPLRAGLYEFQPQEGTAQFLMESIEFAHIQNAHQFIVADGPFIPKETSTESHSRLCRLLFNYPVANGNRNISSEALSAADWVVQKAVKGGVP